MIMMEGWAAAIFYASALGQFALVAVSFFFLGKLLPARRRRWLHLPERPWKHVRVTEERLAFWKLSKDSLYYQARAALLAGCGLEYDPGLYLLVRRISMLACMLVATGCGAWLAIGAARPIQAAIMAVSAAVFMCAYADKSILGAWKKARSRRIIQEVHAISVQLLYLQGSSLHIHAKLMRCVPYTRALRSDLQRLLGEWYHDAEESIRQFKHRIGTEEGMSFAETIESLRVHDHEAYYVLLRERIRDYKDKLELLKESRKESSSYLLFVLAGIPILYTFQVFIYPWVRESQALFNSLN
ncbi:hypothetical protein SAMN05880570_4325 [Paenibacillus sp. RU4T]|nr:hypothetical protein SAMN05880555_4323 [Paenibacillus sp. RU4X]SIR66544.1 hypothetical protein SAMN05880570_4325 [Paenibacillus sp. RU4T]